MKKLLTIVLILGISGFFANIYGQETKSQDRKGGFAVGGFDNTRQEKSATKRSVPMPAEAEQSEKAEERAAPAAVPSAQPAPQDAAAKPQNENKSNAYGQDKAGLEGKDFGQARSQDAKSKQKAKKNAKSKGKNK